MNLSGNSICYPYVDHLGSVVALTDGRGTVVHRQAFDAWGRRRNAQSWVTDDSQVPAAQYRWLWGYTGHEMLDEFGLINMNARLYDPKLGRMLSVDNYVSDATSALGYNRYSYANCNPISYVDPDGNHPVLIAMVIGAAISAATYTAQAAFSPGGLQRNFNVGDFAISTVTGAVMGGVTYGVGSAFGGVGVAANGVDKLGFGMSLLKEAGRASAHGMIGASMSMFDGGSFWSGFAGGAAGSFASSLVGMSGLELGKVGGAFFSAGVGAGSSYLSGGNPWIGAASGLMSYTLNHLMHDGDGDGGGDGDGKKKNNPAKSEITVEEVVKHGAGPGLYLSGQPLKVLKPVGALGSEPGSSVASVAFRKLIPDRHTYTRVMSKWFGENGLKYGRMIRGFVGTNGIGATLGRTIPFIGSAITIYDYSINVAMPMGNANGLYHLSNTRSGNWISNLPH